MHCIQNIVLKKSLSNYVLGIMLLIMIWWMVQMEVSMTQANCLIQDIICILFNNDKIGTLTRIKNSDLYEHGMHLLWTPMKFISKDVQVGQKSTTIFLQGL